MRVVVDTNVLVSALLTLSGVPAQVLTRLLSGEAVVLYDDRILREYREVLARAKFKFDPGEVGAVLELLTAKGESVTAAPLVGVVELPDPKDVPFLEVAVAGQADALVTGNARHFPDTRGVDLLTPRELLDRLESVDEP